jgi:hypothetical protein
MSRRKKLPIALALRPGFEYHTADSHDNATLLHKRMAEYRARMRPATVKKVPALIVDSVQSLKRRSA